MPETRAVNRHISEFLTPAAAEAATAEDLLTSLVVAATNEEDAPAVVVRPVGEFGVRYRARIGPCGPPRGRAHRALGVGRRLHSAAAACAP